jgi:hypothetical protein
VLHTSTCTSTCIHFPRGTAQPWTAYMVIYLNTHAHKPATGHGSNGRHVMPWDPGTHKLITTYFFFWKALITTNTSTCKISTQTGRTTQPVSQHPSLWITLKPLPTAFANKSNYPSMQITTPHAKAPPLDSWHSPGQNALLHASTCMHITTCTSLTNSRTHLARRTTRTNSNNKIMSNNLLSVFCATK